VGDECPEASRPIRGCARSSEPLRTRSSPRGGAVGLRVARRNRESRPGSR
jgi:hypothetical protein